MQTNVREKHGVLLEGLLGGTKLRQHWWLSSLDSQSILLHVSTMTLIIIAVLYQYYKL